MERLRSQNGRGEGAGIEEILDRHADLKTARSIYRTCVEQYPGRLIMLERSYRQTLRDLGCQELDAQVWISAVMFRLRSQVAQHEEEGSASEAEII